MSGFLLDTNALSEATKPNPDSGYNRWFNNVHDDQLFISCLVLGEIQKGVASVQNHSQQSKLQQHLDKVIHTFHDTILPIDQQDCLLWGKLLAKCRQSGTSAPVIDAMLAAQAMRHGLTLVTRNSKDFVQFTELQVHNPWST